MALVAPADSFILGYFLKTLRYVRSGLLTSKAGAHERELTRNGNWLFEVGNLNGRAKWGFLVGEPKANLKQT